MRWLNGSAWLELAARADRVPIRGREILSSVRRMVDPIAGVSQCRPGLLGFVTVPLPCRIVVPGFPRRTLR